MARQQQDNDKTNVETVHSMMPFTPGPTTTNGPGVKGIIGMHRFNICLVFVLLLSCPGVHTVSAKPTGPTWCTRYTSTRFR